MSRKDQFRWGDAEEDDDIGMDDVLPGKQVLDCCDIRRRLLIDVNENIRVVARGDKIEDRKKWSLDSNRVYRSGSFSGLIVAF